MWHPLSFLRGRLPLKQTNKQTNMVWVKCLDTFFIPSHNWGQLWMMSSKTNEAGRWVGKREWHPWLEICMFGAREPAVGGHILWVLQFSTEYRSTIAIYVYVCRMSHSVVRRIWNLSWKIEELRYVTTWGHDDWKIQELITAFVFSKSIWQVETLV